MKKKHLADGVLALSLAGAAGGMVLPAGFWSGFFHHGFLAASIGGLADWFAVTALFRRPLGISYRTEILKRKRSHIMGAITDYATKDILSPENLVAAFQKINLADLFLMYLRERGGKERINDTAFLILTQIIAAMDKEKLAAESARSMRGRIFSLPWEKLFEEALRQGAAPPQNKMLLRTLALSAKEAVFSEPVQETVRKTIGEVTKEYEEGNGLRGFLIGIADLSEGSVLEVINQKLRGLFKELEEGSGPCFDFFSEKLSAALESMANGEETKKLLRDVKGKYAEEFPLGKLILSLLNGLDANNSVLKETFDRFLSEKMAEFEKNEKMQRDLDDFLKKKLFATIREKHHLIRELVEKRLASFSDEELTEFVESRVADDLSMIRINGAVVGAALGMGLYTLAWCMERLWNL